MELMFNLDGCSRMRSPQKFCSEKTRQFLKQWQSQTASSLEKPTISKCIW